MPPRQSETTEFLTEEEVRNRPNRYTETTHKHWCKSLQGGTACECSCQSQNKISKSHIIKDGNGKVVGKCETTIESPRTTPLPPTLIEQYRRQLIEELRDEVDNKHSDYIKNLLHSAANNLEDALDGR